LEDSQSKRNITCELGLLDYFFNQHGEDGSVTYMLLFNCALKLVEEIILYYDARSKKHQITCECLSAD